MQDNEFFVVDMANCSSTGEVINSLTLALEALSHTGKKIVLKLNDSRFNQSQMLSIQSLIASYGCILDTVETTNFETARIAENMNIFVQEPIEKRVGTQQENVSDEDSFQKFTMNRVDDNIALKDVTGFHFEADLDAIQKQQDSINISSDLESAGINTGSDFQSIEEQVIQKYSKPEDAAGSYTSFSSTLTDKFENTDESTNINDDGDADSAQNPADSSDEILPANNFKSDVLLNKDVSGIDNKSKTTIPPKPGHDNLERNTISVYKKAYDEFEPEKEDWEEVDFYETPTNEPIVRDSKKTVYINQTLRSGQILEFDGNVVIIGDCHPGSEIRAVGDVTVWGVLSGVAHAGCKGNLNAKVRALKMNAVQLRIGNCYSRRPDSTNIPYIIKSSVFTPEEARVVDNEIMLFKINQN